MVQVAAPPAPSSRLVDASGRPAHGLPAAPSGVPAGILPPGHALAPLRRGSSQLLRPGLDANGSLADPYQTMLDGLADIMPEDNRVPPEFFNALVPDAEAAAQVGVSPHDPVQAAHWRGGAPALRSVPLTKEE